MLTHVNSWMLPEEGHENPAFSSVSHILKKMNPKRKGGKRPKSRKINKEKACMVYSSDCKIFSLVALGEIQLCVLVHALPIRGGVSFATLTFLAPGKTVILFSTSNVWSVTALKVRSVLWSTGECCALCFRISSRRIFLSIATYCTGCCVSF